MKNEKGLIDIHSHILPGVDDGASDFEESVRMLGQSYREGIRVIITTTHFGMSNMRYDAEAVVRGKRQLEKAISRLGVEMVLLDGSELFWRDGIIDEVKNNRKLCLGNTDYILVEFGLEDSFDTLEKATRSFVLEGYRPVIAHLERYSAMVNDIGAVQKLVDTGAFIQINARSLMSGGREQRFRWCSQLIDNDLVHFVATDAHDSTRRKPEMMGAMKNVSEGWGSAKAEKLFFENTEKLLNNEYL